MNKLFAVALTFLVATPAFAESLGTLRCLLVNPDRTQSSQSVAINEGDTTITFQAEDPNLLIVGGYNSVLNSTQVSIGDTKSGYKTLSTDWAQSKDQKWSSSSVLFTLPNGDTYILQCNADLITAAPVAAPSNLVSANISLPDVIRCKQATTSYQLSLVTKHPQLPAGVSMFQLKNGTEVVFKVAAQMSIEKGVLEFTEAPSTSSSKHVTLDLDRKTAVLSNYSDSKLSDFSFQCDL